MLITITLLHSEQPKLHRVLAVLSAEGLTTYECLDWLKKKKNDLFPKCMYTCIYYSSRVALLKKKRKNDQCLKCMYTCSAPDKKG